MFRMLFLAALAACGGKPATQAPSNTATGSTAPPAATAVSTGDCAAQQTCTGCLSTASPDPDKGSCQWDTRKQSCQVACEPGTRNCVLTAARNLKPAELTDVCANAKPVDP